jgi:hypothetical protein
MTNELPVETYIPSTIVVIHIVALEECFETVISLKMHALNFCKISLKTV